MCLAFQPECAIHPRLSKHIRVWIAMSHGPKSDISDFASSASR